MDLWSLIFKIEAEEYDCVPNNWLISKERCWYPDKSKNTTVKLAKENARVIDESDWIQIKISIKQKNFENYERCMIDALRLNQGKRSITESENEVRGRGLRAKRPLHRRSESESDSNVDLTPDKRKTMEVASPEIISFPLSSPKSKKQKLGEKQVTRDLNCKIKRRHFCIFKQGDKPMSIETIAQGICSLSRSVNLLRGAIEDVHQDIISRLQPANSNEKAIEPASTTTEFEDNDEGKFDEVLQIFPITNVEDFKKFDEKLQDEGFRREVAYALMSVATKTSFSRAVTSVLRYALHEDITQYFSWKGQKRWREKKEAFSTSKFSRMLIDTIRKRWTSVDKMRIEKSIASWLAQSQVRLKTKKTSGSPNESM